MSNDPIPLTEFRIQLGSSVKRVRAGEHVLIGRFDEPFAVLIPYADYVRKFGGAAQPTNPAAGYGPDFSDGT